VNRLRQLPGVAGRPASEIRQLVREWHRQALPAINTESFAVTWREARCLWARTDSAKQTFQRIADAAMQERPPALVELLGYAGDKATVRLVLLCRALQRHHAPKPFFLGCRHAGAVAGVDRTTAHGIMQMLVEDGVIELVTKGTRGRASEWRYLGDD
jgi:hypothetical protein